MACNSLAEFIYPGSNVLTAHLSGGANSAPQTSWLDFGQGRTSGKGWGKNGREGTWEGKGQRKKKRGEERGVRIKGGEKGKGGILFYAVVIFP